MKDIAEGRTLAGKYRLERELGGGSMGAVWLGFDAKLRRRVVVKFLRALTDKDPHMVARFEREARAAARVRSPHVIETYDYGIDRGLPFIILEYLEGEDLSSRLTREQKLSPDHTAAIAKQIGKALDAVHAAGIVHRDLKPGNIFLMTAGDEDFVKLLDFGIAKAASAGSSRITQTGVVLGTPRYMSPEQTNSENEVDFRTDLWSLAVILYRTVTGLCPFFGATMFELIHNICNSLFPSACESAPELPPSVDRFFEQAFKANPDERFQSGKELVHAFHVALQGRSVRAAGCSTGGFGESGPPSLDRPTLPGLGVQEQEKETTQNMGPSYFRPEMADELPAPSRSGSPGAAGPPSVARPGPSRPDDDTCQPSVSSRDAETLNGPMPL